jgi:hypothetical protein
VPRDEDLINDIVAHSQQMKPTLMNTTIMMAIYELMVSTEDIEISALVKYMSTPDFKSLAYLEETYMMQSSPTTVKMDSDDNDHRVSSQFAEVEDFEDPNGHTIFRAHSLNLLMYNIR